MTDEPRSEALACTPRPINDAFFSSQCLLPCDLFGNPCPAAMTEFLDLLGFINQQLHTRNMPRLESF